MLNSIKTMYKIKFGTDGWREIIADNFTTANVRRVSEATANWLNEESNSPSCIVGYDCRFGGEMFAGETARVLASKGVKVYLSNGFVSTPMVSLAAKKLNCTAGIIITASHNPPSYNGFKIKAGYGGPATPSVIEKVEGLIPESDYAVCESLNNLVSENKIEYRDFEEMYLKHVKDCFDMQALDSVSDKFIYDAMYGAGQNVIKKLFPKATLLHCEHNPGFEGRAPEPILKNLPEISETMAMSGKFLCGLATDGDADRIGFFDENGKFVDSHHLILLLIQYLTEFKGYSGKVVKSFSVSDKVDALCKAKSLTSQTTKIGFKYICEMMVTDDVLIGAEESGGIAIKGHIPERDGIWMGLVLMEYMAKTGKKISELIAEVYEIVGSFSVERYDLHINEEQKQQIVAQCRNNGYSNFGSYQVQSVENIDGFKFRLGDAGWVMIRASGTEPVLRVYAESNSSDSCFAILDAVKASILSA
jgi:phosphomannomutase